MDNASRTGRRRRIEIRRIAKSAAARGRNTSLGLYREGRTSTKLKFSKDSLHSRHSASDDRRTCSKHSGLSTTLSGVPDTLDTVSCSQAEKSKQYCRSESTVGSVSGMTSQAATAPTAPPPFSHEEFSTLSEMPSVHGVDGIGGRGSAYTITPPTLSSHKLPSISHVDGYSASHSSCPPHGAVSVCGRRRNMEDFVHIAPDFVPVTKNPGGALHFFGVFDGHGGHQVSRYCAEHLHDLLATECVRAFEDYKETGGVWESALQQAMATAFLKIDTEIGNCAVSDFAVFHSMAEATGSTAVVVMVDSQNLTVANCGDSRAVLSRQGKTVPLTCDHKPQRPDELKRIEAAGGQVLFRGGLRVGGILAMTRAIGDRFLKPSVIADPEVVCIPRSKHDDFFILASDGLWDVVTNDVACEVVRRCIQNSQKLKLEFADADDDFGSPCTFAASLLTKLALAAGSTDNISVLVVDLATQK